MIRKKYYDNKNFGLTNFSTVYLKKKKLKRQISDSVLRKALPEIMTSMCEV